MVDSFPQEEVGELLSSAARELPRSGNVEHSLPISRQRSLVEKQSNHKFYRVWKPEEAMTLYMAIENQQPTCLANRQIYTFAQILLVTCPWFRELLGIWRANWGLKELWKREKEKKCVVFRSCHVLLLSAQNLFLAGKVRLSRRSEYIKNGRQPSLIESAARQGKLPWTCLGQ